MNTRRIQTDLAARGLYTDRIDGAWGRNTEAAYRELLERADACAPAPTASDRNMKLDNVLTQMVDPALDLLPDKMDSIAARIELLAIGLQESRFEHRRQLVGSPSRPVGPAKSFWQGEKGGGMVHGVRTHDAVSRHAFTLYKARGVEPNNQAIWDAIEHDDVLAAGLARLLLWTDPKALPAIGDAQGAWDLYIRTWRPGKPHRDTWDAFYHQAVQAVQDHG